MTATKEERTMYRAAIREMTHIYTALAYRFLATDAAAPEAETISAQEWNAASDLRHRGSVSLLVTIFRQECTD